MSVCLQEGSSKPQTNIILLYAAAWVTIWERLLPPFKEISSLFILKLEVEAILSLPPPPTLPHVSSEASRSVAATNKYKADTEI